MNLDIRVVHKDEYPRVHDFQCEYLDKENYDEFVSRIEAAPDLYLAAFADDGLAGICYGHPSRKSENAVNLQGIAVNLDPTKSYARRGIGSKLLECFEQAVRRGGYRTIDLGAADDLKVERFYLKNGFVPYELVAKGRDHAEYERVRINSYEHGKMIQQHLRTKHNPTEVIFIFHKAISNP